VNYKIRDFFAEVMAATADRGVDLVLDPVGASHLDRNLKLLRENGRLVCIGLLSGSKAELNLGLVLGKSLRIIGSRLRGLPLSEKIAITRNFTERFWPLLAKDVLQPVIDTVFPIKAAQAAHEHVRQNRNIGKVVLTIHSS
jgi:NADPH:quinone reductase-like Zn-dependent oxidoreductase